jgi:hypothetical protein
MCVLLLLLCALLLHGAAAAWCCSYRMDYTQLLNYHRAKGADVTIATTPADEEHATHLGVLTVRSSTCKCDLHICMRL